MAFLNKTGLQTLTNKLVQGDAIKVASSKGTTIKEVIDNIQRECESVALPNTMTLENRVNEFKIGQSRDIDVSGDIEEGISQIEFKGQTYQNLLYNAKRIFGSTSCDVVILDAKKLSFEIIYKNDITGNTAANRATIESDFKNMLQPNKVYTFIYKYTLLENPKNQDCQLGIAIDMWGDNLANSKICKKNGFSDINIAKVTTANSEKFDSMATRINFINKKGQNSKWRIDGLLILEGDYSQIPIEEIPQYFEGIKSSFEDKVANINIQGKNFFDVSKLTAFKVNNVNIFWSGDKLLLNGAINNTWTSFATSNALPKGTYSLRVYDKGVYWGGKAKIWGYNSEGKLIANVGNGTTFTIEEDIFNIKLVIEGFQSGTMIDAELTIQIERAVKFTPYEPYYNYNYTFDIKEPLRRLPNNIYDEIRNNNGKWELVRRIGKVVLDGSESWEIFSGRKYFQLPTSFIKSNYTNVPLICDKVASVPYLTLDNSIGYGTNLSYFLRLNLQEVDVQNGGTIGQLKQWLKTNPLTIYYKLDNPIITLINPIEFNVSQGTTITISSDIAPISIHEVILNRAGQIEQGVNLIADLRNRVNTLESIYDSNLLATQYKLDNLKLNYELEREED